MQLSNTKSQQKYLKKLLDNKPLIQCLNFILYFKNTKNAYISMFKFKNNTIIIGIDYSLQTSIKNIPNIIVYKFKFILHK